MGKNCYNTLSKGNGDKLWTDCSHALDLLLQASRVVKGVFVMATVALKVARRVETLVALPVATLSLCVGKILKSGQI